MDRLASFVFVVAVLVIYGNCGVVPPPPVVTDDVSVETVKYHEQEKCGFNRRFTSCGNLCNTTCKTMGPFCAEECTEGCLCNEGYGVFSMLDICVPIVSPLCKFERHRY